MIQQPLGRVSGEWRPQGFGRRRSPAIVDPLVEPLWIGERVLILQADGSPARAILGDGTPLDEAVDRPIDVGARGLDAVMAAVATAVNASSAVLDGYLTHQAAQPPEGRAAGLDGPDRPRPGRRLLLGDSNARQAAERRERVKKAGEAYAAAGLPLVFVAVDLLEVDGQILLDIPLLERKRHLDAIVEETELVRVSPFVRGPATGWYGTWRAIGFFEMALKAANSRYRPGEANDDWAIAPIPRR